MMQNFYRLKGCTLAATDGEIGKVREMYFDDQEWTVRYLVVTAGSWLTGRDVLIATRALGEVDAQSATIAVNLTKEQVRDAPPLESDRPVSRQDEERHHQHYGWTPYWIVPGGGPGMMLPPSVLAPAPAFAPRPGVTENLDPDVTPEQPQGDPNLRSSREVCGYTIRAQDGELGHVADFIIDNADWRIRYLIVATRDWLPGKHVLLAPHWIELISFDKEQVFVNLPRSVIKDAPDFGLAGPVSRAYEERLHTHYRQKAYWEAVEEARP